METMTEKAMTWDEWMELPESVRHDVEKATFHRHLDAAGLFAAKFLRQHLVDGRVDGNYSDPVERPDSKYGACACIIGTLVEARRKGGYSFNGYRYNEFDRIRDAGQVKVPLMEEYDIIDSSPVEPLILNVRPGDTPENCKEIRTLVEWTDEWIANN